eukprot:COSAG01_NODE_3748_length_5737_cov_64.443597_7_plen_139_part_01
MRADIRDTELPAHRPEVALPVRAHAALISRPEPTLRDQKRSSSPVSTALRLPRSVTDEPPPPPPALLSPVAKPNKTSTAETRQCSNISRLSQQCAPRPDSPCVCWGMQPAPIFDKKALRRAAARRSPQLPPMSEWRRPR